MPLSRSSRARKGPASQSGRAPRRHSPETLPSRHHRSIRRTPHESPAAMAAPRDRNNLYQPNPSLRQSSTACSLASRSQLRDRLVSQAKSATRRRRQAALELPSHRLRKASRRDLVELIPPSNKTQSAPFLHSIWEAHSRRGVLPERFAYCSKSI